jgi:hypothetical protein
MSGLTASNLPVVCGAAVVICTSSVRKRAMRHRYRHAATASRLQPRQGRDATEKVAESAQKYIGKGVSCNHTTPGLTIAAALASNTQQRPHPPHSTTGRIRSIEKCNDLIGNRPRDLPACSIVPQPTTLPRASPVCSRDTNSIDISLEVCIARTSSTKKCHFIGRQSEIR